MQVTNLMSQVVLQVNESLSWAGQNVKYSPHTQKIQQSFPEELEDNEFQISGKFRMRKFVHQADKLQSFFHQCW